MRPTLISDLRRLAKWYNLSYPATSKLLREAACELESAQCLLETVRASHDWTVKRNEWLSDSEPE